MEEKDIRAITETLDKGLASVGNKLEAQLSELNKTATEAFNVKPEDILTGKDKVEPAPASAKAEEDADMEQPLSGITRIKVWDIPLGEIAVGSFTAVFTSELIDGFLAAQSDMTKGIVKLVGSGAAIKWGGRIMGKNGAYALGLLLGYDGLRSIIALDSWAKRLSTSVSGVIPGGGLGGFKKNTGVVAQAETVASDYYARATGG